QRLLNFFSNSQWLINKQANYTYTFYFKTPSTSIKKWVERILNGAKESANVDGSKSNDGQYGIDLNFFPNIFDDFEVSFRSIFQNLVMRNIFSFIKMFPSLRIGNSEYTNAFCLYFIEKNFFQEGLTCDIFVECFVEFNQMWESQSKARSYNFDIQYAQFLCQRFFDSMRTISEITCAAVDRRYLKNGDAFSTNDYNSIISMLDGLSSLHPGLASNFKYGWEGFSTGEFAKLNIFSSLFNIIQEGGGKGLIVIDEIDLFLHPEWQRTLISELISFYNDYKNVSDLQFIITTHSPLIIGDLLPEDIISLYINDDGIPERMESFGFGTEITDAYVSGMHIKSTFGEHSRKKLVELIDKKVTNDLDANDKLLAAKISNKELKKRLLDD
ncbi:AAA family ATPase, partial [Enterobacteriaceae bacterium RIT691]|nr:AAA family ATPase [Enterobacteriaceae bacterium RIT691]